MKLTKERRVYAAILGLAGAVWAIDRLWLSGGPESASASAIAAGEPAAAPAPAPAAGSSAPKAALADRLESLRRSLPAAPEGDDAFRVPTEWRPNSAEAQAAAVPAAPRFDTEAFSKSHRLTRVLMGSNVNAAVVDGGSMLRPGQELDGMVLKEVTARGAIFERDGARVELTLEGPAGAVVKVGGASENGGVGNESR